MRVRGNRLGPPRRAFGGCLGLINGRRAGNARKRWLLGMGDRVGALRARRAARCSRCSLDLGSEGGAARAPPHTRGESQVWIVARRGANRRPPLPGRGAVRQGRAGGGWGAAAQGGVQAGAGLWRLGGSRPQGHVHRASVARARLAMEGIRVLARRGRGGL
ncbi:MAG: hypothetical protein J3K34DRAFT_424921 [Monoraphidium minutum]|nr:MAG: hypothetical protein J3K34DRAFT_424921 [Monoraphidium minutum]